MPSAVCLVPCSRLLSRLLSSDIHSKTVANWKTNQHHVDIWLGPTEHDDGAVPCENTLTPGSGVAVIRDDGGQADQVDGILPDTIEKKGKEKKLTSQMHRYMQTGSVM